MFRRLALTGDVSESTQCAEEWLGCGEDPVDEPELDADFGVGVDIRRRFDTGKSSFVGIKSLSNLSCPCE